jgi:diguanylate cyclase (GGDEF)-like protein
MCIVLCISGCAIGFNKNGEFYCTDGDEFIIVLPEISLPQDACVIAKKILTALHQPVWLGSKDFETFASIGIAVRASDDSDDESDLMKKADIAMYEAKRCGRDGYCLFEPSMAV